MISTSLLALYCPLNQSLNVIWYDHGFSHCFLFTLYTVLLGSLMLTLGSAEIWMYLRHGNLTTTRLRVNTWYFIQVAGLILLFVLPTVELVIQVAVYAQPLYGYQLLYAAARTVLWTFVLIIICLERHLELPSPPARGHSVFLVVFLGLFFVFQNLVIVNFNSKHWHFLIHSESDRAAVGLFGAEYTLIFAEFILILYAPGLLTTEDRIYGSSSYSDLLPIKTYGTTDEITTVESLGQSSGNRSVELLRAQLDSGELLRACNNILSSAPNTSNSSGVGQASSSAVPAFCSAVCLPVGNLELRYLLVQEPCANPEEFWRVLWEMECKSLISFGSYSAAPDLFPLLNDSARHNNILVTCLHEHNRYSFPFRRLFTVREFSLINLELQKELTVLCYELTKSATGFAALSTLPMTQLLLQVRTKAGLHSPLVLCSDCKQTQASAVIFADTLLHNVIAEQEFEVVPLVQRLVMQTNITTKDLVTACNCVLSMNEKLRKGNMFTNICSS